LEEPEEPEAIAAPATNLRALDRPAIDSTIVETLRTALSQAESGEITGIALITSQRSGQWTQSICGDTMYHNVAGLNLRIDMLKRLLLKQIVVVSEES
jgi:hypothetical protein